MCSADRAATLRRAVDSVLSQAGVRARVIAVVNGGRVDDAVLAELCATPAVRVIRLEEGSPPKAIHVGRDAVDTPYFGFLDDDDELLPGTLRTRIDELERNPEIDVVVTNGYHHLNGADTIYLAEMSHLRADPLGTLIERNWLLSCAGTYRASAAPVTAFADVPKYFEWTAIAFRLGVDGHRFAFVNVPAYRIHDTPASLSKSDAFHMAEVGVLHELARRAPSTRIRRMMHRKLSAAYHTRSNQALDAGELADAWRWHLRSLRYVGGLRHLPYTRHLIRLYASSSSANSNG